MFRTLYNRCICRNLGYSESWMGEPNVPWPPGLLRPCSSPQFHCLTNVLSISFLLHKRKLEKLTSSCIQFTVFTWKTYEYKSKHVVASFHSSLRSIGLKRFYFRCQVFGAEFLQKMNKLKLILIKTFEKGSWCKNFKR